MSKAYYLDGKLENGIDELSELIASSYLSYEGYLRRALMRMLAKGAASDDPRIDEDIKRYAEIIAKVAKEDPKSALYQEISGPGGRYDKREVRALKKIYKRLKLFI